MKTLLTILVLVALMAGGGLYIANYITAEPLATFRTAVIKRDRIVPTIPATGTVEPEEVIDVGAQVVGRVKDFGIDPADETKTKRIDNNTNVHVGTILAYIDDEVYKAQVEQAEAGLERAEADTLQAEAKVRQADLDLARSRGLLSLNNIPGASRPIKGIADSEYENSVANEQIARANLSISKAAIKQQQAILRLAKTNVDYTVIKSPVEGMIIDKRVQIGQTVVSSLNAPSLFLIAKDMSRMQVWASVNEADIGRIRPDMNVIFTVDAFPNEEFHGTVIQVRNNATSTQNVVTYTVIVGTDNSNRRLMPYLTANLKFEIDERTDVMTVPNAALRYKPKAEQVALEYREALTNEKKNKKPTDSSGSPGGKEKDAASGGSGRSTKGGKKDDAKRLWVKEGEFLKPIDVQAGVSDGVITEVMGTAISEGMEVVLGELRKDQVGDETTNPFAPKMFGGPKKTK